MQPEVVGETILIVDDEAFSLDFCCETLSRSGFQVLRAQSGVEALALFKRHASRISLALVDVMMPEMTGIELSKRLQDRHFGLKIALMSGYTPEEVERLIGSEGSTYRIFWKPFDVRIFVQMIRNVLDAPPPLRASAARP